jgi:hypothetical protein
MQVKPVLELYTMCSPEVPFLTNFKYKMHIREILAFLCFIFHFNREECVLENSHLCVTVEK